MVQVPLQKPSVSQKQTYSGECGGAGRSGAETARGAGEESRGDSSTVGGVHPYHGVLRNDMIYVRDLSLDFGLHVQICLFTTARPRRRCSPGARGGGCRVRIELGYVSNVQYLYIHVPIRQPRSLWRGSAKARSPWCCQCTSHTRTVAWSGLTFPPCGQQRARPLTDSFRVGAGLGGNLTAVHHVWFLHLASSPAMTGRARSKNDRHCATSRSVWCHRHLGRFQATGRD